MRKKILAMLPVGLVALSLTGCADNPNTQLSDEIEALTDRYALARTSGFGLTGPRTYTVAHSVDSAQVPADMSSQAVKLDELLAMRPDIQAAYDDPAAQPGQKAVLARMLAEIDLAHAYYLGQVAENSYDQAKTGTTALQPYANKVDLMLGVIAMRQGDRATIIDTLQTGNAGNNMQIEGVQQLEARVQAIQSRIDAALEEVRKHEAEAEDANRDVGSYDELQLELAVEARPQTGEAQFSTLNQSVDAWLQARLAEIKAESHTLLAAAHTQSAEMNQHDLQMVQSVVAGLEESISKVRDEMTRLRGEVTAAQREKDAAATELDNEYQEVNGQMQQLVFSRLTQAIDKAAGAAALYGGITATGGAQEAMQREQLTAMLVQLQLYHQYAIETSGYKSAIDGLLANGEIVLGRSLASDLETLSSDLEAQLAAIKAEAAPVQDAAADLAGILVNRAAAGSLAADLLTEQSDRLEAIRSGLAELPYGS
ncbi:hypothetical protein OT109_17765 [Phycisphaeraceae bacterium D3-23]